MVGTIVSFILVKCPGMAKVTITSPADLPKGVLFPAIDKMISRNKVYSEKEDEKVDQSYL